MDISSEKVLEVINQLMEENKINENNMNESLLSHNIDSLKFIQMIVLLEESFDIEFPDDSLIMDQYATFGSIVDMVKKIIRENGGKGQLEEQTDNYQYCDVHL